ncbi:alanine racemase [Salinibacterium hongtaonis]|uniref:alanine racemase n=1 Tax=Homoserinimonas hongtaonis TaxID=2079791 RepID=UPI000D37298F|nr:alanine racemase [Salinibacterium hongtaonis]AWB89965.1 alanine racemase [Salinibacterium hongtaonis]
MTGALRNLSVSLGAITRNVEHLRNVVGTQHTMAVVKAQAYGHGAVESARAAIAGGADWLGVADISEGLALRRAGLDAPILAWLHDPEQDFSQAVAERIDLGVSYLAQLDRVADAGFARVHLKVDTGLSRNGVERAHWAAVFARAAELEKSGRIRVVGMFSHLANAGRASDLDQVAVFDEAIAAARDAGLRPELLHIAATAGAIDLPEARYNLVRLGIGIYGLSPFEDRSSADLALEPAMRLTARIAAVKRVPAGSGVSYGLSYRTAKETTLALIPLGYADGIPRHASGTGAVWVNGVVCPIAGRIAMDQFVVDLGTVEASIDDEAVLFGDPADGVPSADEWALACDTINYEIVTRLGGRIVRSFRP